MISNKTLLCLGLLIAVCVMVLLVDLFRSATVSNVLGEGGRGAIHAAAQSPGQLSGHQGVQLPSGIGNQQMQMINTRIPAGIGDQQMQLIHHLGPQFPSGLGNGQMQLLDARLPMGIGGGQMQLIQTGGPYLGLGISDIPPNVAARLGIAVDKGVLVGAVVSHSPGQFAGIEAGDVLLSIDNKDLSESADVGRALTGKKAGDVVKAVVNRGGTKRSMHITLAKVPQEVVTGQGGNSPVIVAVLNSDKDLRSQIGGEKSSKSVILVDIGQKNYTVLELRNLGPLPEVLAQHRVNTLICADISNNMANALRQNGITTYTGVVGNILDGVALYEKRMLISTTGF